MKEAEEHKDGISVANADTSSRGTSASATRNANLKSLVRYDKRRRVYVCITCEREYARLDVMRRHVRCHTGERPYSCNVCQRTFILQHHLNCHKRTHSTCSKTSDDSSSLRKRTRVHTGERPFSCDMCPRRFANAASLAAHKHTHTKKLPLPDRSTERCIDSDNSNASTEVMSSPEGVDCTGNSSERFADSQRLDIRTNADTEEPSSTKWENIGNSEQSTNSNASDVHTLSLIHI